MKATEGNGGQPIKVSREPVRAPIIPRGALTLPVRTPPNADKVSFASSSLAPGYLLTYTDIDVLSLNGDRTNVFVGPHDVVTWDKL